MAQISPGGPTRPPTLILVGTLVLGGGGSFGLYWWASPYHTDVGYKPTQPVAYSHALHAGDLDVDCRYCHACVERSAYAGVPPTATCMNCHAQVKKDSEKLENAARQLGRRQGRRSRLEWVRIHKLPDFAFFNHSAHMGVGVGENRAAIGCETCHGRIDTMDVVKPDPTAVDELVPRVPLEPGAEPAAGRPDHHHGVVLEPRVARQGAAHRHHAQPAGQPDGRAEGDRPTATSRPSRPPAAAAVTADPHGRVTLFGTPRGRHEEGPLRSPAAPMNEAPKHWRSLEHRLVTRR